MGMNPSEEGWLMRVGDSITTFTWKGLNRIDLERWAPLETRYPLLDLHKLFHRCCPYFRFRLVNMKYVLYQHI